MVHEFRLLARFDRLRQALKALSNASIEVILLKGTGLAVSRYKRIADRSMQDHDLLVHPGKALMAREVLAELGWMWTADHDAEKRYRRHHHLPPLHRPGDDSTTVELHVGLFPSESPLRVSLQELWDRAEPAQMQDVSALVPDREHQMLHAALHYGYSHVFLRGAARLLSDLRVLAEEGRPDWDRFVKLGVASRAAASCYWALWVAAEVGGLAVPAEVMRALRPARNAMAMKLANRYILGGMIADGSDCPSSALQRMMWELASDPVRAGHGSARPWDLDPDKPPPAPGTKRGWAILRPSYRLEPWVRYFRALSSPLARIR
jgi:hypothetical protein